MELGSLRQGMIVQVKYIPKCPLKARLRQFGLMEGSMVQCRYARKNILALEWSGTVVAVRRKDIKGFVAQVVI